MRFFEKLMVAYFFWYRLGDDVKTVQRSLELGSQETC